MGARRADARALLIRLANGRSLSQSEINAFANPGGADMRLTLLDRVARLSRLRRRSGRRQIVGYRTRLAMFAAPLLLLASAEGAHAHSWYPPRCCSGEDCRKVERIDFLPDGAMIMHAGPMKVMVPRFFVQEPSADGDAHICAVSIAIGIYLPVCVFMPGTS